MALFPATQYPAFGYRAWHEENVSKAEARDSYFQQKDLWGGLTRFRASMRFDGRTTDVLTITAFWKINRTSAFDFIDYDEDVYVLDTFRHLTTRAAVPLTDGTAVYEIRAKRVSGVTVYIAGSAVASSGYAIVEGTGNDGMARLTFSVAPTAGQSIAISYTGQRLFPGCRFAQTPVKESTGWKRQTYPVEVFQDLRLII